MKRYCFAFTLLILTLNLSFGKIKNGYANGIISARGSLKDLQALLQDEKEMKGSTKKMIELKVKELVNYLAYYELTESLLKQFRLVASDLYNEIDTIRDLDGRITDVYVKFIPEEQAKVQAWGTTNVAQVAGDLDACYSEYGKHSVSVKVWIVSKALKVLSHELGHVKYQVSNLASYLEYYKMHYRPGTVESNNLGHKPDDKSGKSASAYAIKFRKSCHSYLKNGHIPFQSPLVLMENFRKEVKLETMVSDHIARL